MKYFEARHFSCLLRVARSSFLPKAAARCLPAKVSFRPKGRPVPPAPSLSGTRSGCFYRPGVEESWLVLKLSSNKENVAKLTGLESEEDLMRKPGWGSSFRGTFRLALLCALCVFSGLRVEFLILPS